MQQSDRDSGLPPSSSGTLTVSGCSPADGQASPSMTTCASSGPPAEAPASSAAAFLVRTSATPASGKDLAANDPACGTSSLGSLAWWDPASLSWKTWQRSLLEDWATFSEPFPTSGSMLNGRMYPRAQWAPHICDGECSLWPTPTASMDGRGFGIPLHKRSGRYRQAIVSKVQELVTECGWRIHPHFTETLMGLSLGWTEIEPSATPYIPPKRSRSTKRSPG